MIDIIIAGLAAFLLGWFWYSDNLFGKKWRKEAGVKKTKDNQLFVINLIALFVMAFVLSGLVNFASTLSKSIIMAVYLWLGFMMPVRLHESLWQKKSWNFFTINTIYDLISIVLMASIIFLL